MELLIDTNILLDFLLDRWPFADDAQEVWRACETGKATGYVSVLSFANIVYVMRKMMTPERVEALLLQIAAIFNLVALTPGDLSDAAFKYWKDFEDAVQSATAERLRCDAIVTRNVRDYQGSRVPALSPEAFLKNLDSSAR